MNFTYNLGQSFREKFSRFSTRRNEENIVTVRGFKKSPSQKMMLLNSDPSKRLTFGLRRFLH